MKSFKEEYRQAFNGIKTPEFNAETMKKAKKRYRKAVIRQWTAVAASAAVLFIVCSAGTQAAKNYSKSFIFADENGFRTADEQTALGQAAVSDEEEGMAETMSADAQDMLMGSSYEECQQQAADYESDEPEIMDGAGMEIASTEYGSVQELKEAGITYSLPDRYLLGDINRERYYVVGDDYLMVNIESGDRTFYMDQSYFGNSAGHVTSTVYGEKLTNKRNYVTDDGYLYVVADTSGEGECASGIHAAISVGDYELMIDFYGYREKEAYRILDSIDLEVYRQSSMDTDSGQ